MTAHTSSTWFARRLFQQRRNISRDYADRSIEGEHWEQRGCGNASPHDAQRVSLAQQVDDLRSVLQWFNGETHQRVLMLGISIGATFALQAVERDADRAKSVIAISPDSQTAGSDAAASAFLQDAALRTDSRRLRRRV